MGAPRYLIGLVCAFFAAGCAQSGSDEVDVDNLDPGYETESGPSLPPPAAGATCVFIQRGTLGKVQDSDIGYGNGADWPMGNYPYSWTGISPYQHWSAYQFGLAALPPDA